MAHAARLTALFCTALLTSGGALPTGGAAFAQEAPAEAEEPANRCVSLRSVNGYQVIDDRHLVLTGGASRYYLLTMRTRCSGMRFGAQIGTSFGDNARLCPPFVEYVIPDDGWRCAIDTVVEVESVEAAR